MRSIEYSHIVETNLSDGWNAWTTNKGVRSFLAPESKIDLKLGGAYELYFDLDQPHGSRGTEGMKVLSYIPERLFSFEWNHPAQMQKMRDRKTWIVLEFNELDHELFELTLTHTGFGKGQRWNESYDYFSRIWPTVLNRFEKSLCVGPMAWDTIA